MDVVDPVRELRLVLTVDDWPAAVRFYRDVLGLAQVADFSSDDGQVVLLSAGRATLEVVDARQAEYIDRVEVGRRVAGQVRVAFEVADAASTTDRLTTGGAEVLAPPTRTPWNSLNARLEAPGGLQLTLFEELGSWPVAPTGR
jgi:lactoylglutathione lyase